MLQLIKLIICFFDSKDDQPTDKFTIKRQPCFNPKVSTLLSTNIMRAYYYDNLPGDQRLPHDYSPSRPVPLEKLAALNVRFWSIPVDGHESKVDQVALERWYKNRDTINVSKEGLGDVSSRRNHNVRKCLLMNRHMRRRSKVFSMSAFTEWFQRLINCADNMTLVGTCTKMKRFATSSQEAVSSMSVVSR
jgi:hypothetical protein